MTFTSAQFFVFMPIVFLTFCAVPQRWRWLVLLVASYGFYATFESWSLLITLALVTLIGFAGGLWLDGTKERRGTLLALCTILCLGVLFFTKYLPHLSMARNHALLRGIMSIGVSYYTFQAISYLIDIYLEVQEPERHLGHFALAMAFFPKLLQGPIERAHDLLPQLRIPYQFDYDKVRSGLFLFAQGLFLKVVIAARIARYADTVYDDVHGHVGVSLVLATYCYAVQLYCDFAGYTDMAIGTARVFNIDLVDNFNHPFVATSVTEFWRRWHMSLSRWILDYIFKPLQISWRDWGKAGSAMALIATFLACGIWHGASWGFVVWGLLHGTYMAVSVWYRPYQQKLHAAMGVGKRSWYRFVQMFGTFNLVSFAWIFFRANSFSDALYIVRNLVALSGWVPHAGLRAFVFTRILLSPGIHSIIPLTLMLIVVLSNGREWLSDIKQRPAWIRWAVYFALCYGSVMLGVWDQQFIYFAF
jgi:D-alanyl-lipoteichoic acid acyltransferase DltB (MBOAT superfamily)